MAAPPSPEHYLFMALCFGFFLAKDAIVTFLREMKSLYLSILTFLDFFF